MPDKSVTFKDFMYEFADDWNKKHREKVPYRFINAFVVCLENASKKEIKIERGNND